MNIYNASEGFFGVQNERNSDDMLLLTANCVFYEFLEMIEIKILATQKGIVFISNYGQNITCKDEKEAKTLLQSRSRDDDDIIATVLAYLRKKA